MYHYGICTVSDKELFGKQCAALEKHIPGLEKKEFLHDVDDSLIQIYEKGAARILVHNSENVGALYIDSEIDLDQFFK